MICNICKGSGSFFSSQKSSFHPTEKKFKWFPCPQCNGVGTIKCFSSLTIKMHGVGKKITKLNKQLDFEGRVA